jgi:hypothetical protein
LNISRRIDRAETRFPIANNVSVHVKILVTACSLLLIWLMWLAEPPKTMGQKATLFALARGLSAYGFFRPLMTLSVVLINLGMWIS